MVASLALVGCTAPAPQPSPSPTATETAAEVPIPATPAGRVAQWILDELNAEPDAAEDVWAERMDASLSSAVSAAEVVDLLNRQIRPAQPFAVTGYEGGEREGVLTLQGALGDPFSVTFAISADDLLTGLHIGPAVPPRTPAESMAEIEEELAALGEGARVLVQLDAGDGPVTVLARGDDQAAPLGSVFKLYVLLAVATAVADGELTWDEPLTVTEEVRSLPSGELQDAEEGTTLPVREAALKMISISDNTATDMLIQRVGRERVEDAVALAAHHDPSLLRPFRTTKEMFEIAWGANPELTARWTEGDEAERRELLAEIDGLPLTVTVETFPADRVAWNSGMDWFASAGDVARVHEMLHRLEDPEIEPILTTNPGVDTTEFAADWPRLAFKGGSAPGVLAGSWLGESADGDILTVVLLLSGDDAAEVSAKTAQVFGIAEDIFRLSAQEGDALAPTPSQAP